MGKLVVTEFVSLDGVMEDPGGSEGKAHGAWTFAFDRGEGGNRFKYDELMAADAQLLGRVTYEGFAAAWPSRGGDDFGRRMNEMPKYVVSKTITEPPWQNTTVLDGDLRQDVTAVKERHAGDLLLAGSATLAQGLLAAGLVDELRLMVFPIVLGSGKKLFAEGTKLEGFVLTDTQQSADVAILTLTRKG